MSSHGAGTFDRRALLNFVKEERVIVTGRPIDGIAIINKCGYWDRPILQIVYLDITCKLTP